LELSTDFESATFEFHRYLSAFLSRHPSASAFDQEHRGLRESLTAPCETAFAVDSYCVRTLLASWVETDALRPV